MLIYMYKRQKALREPPLSEIMGQFPTRALRYGHLHRCSHHHYEIINVPIIIPNATIEGYVDNFPLYDEEDFIKFLPYIQNIRGEVVVKVVGGD